MFDVTWNTPIKEIPMKYGIIAGAVAATGSLWFGLKTSITSAMIQIALRKDWLTARGVTGFLQEYSRDYNRESTQRLVDAAVMRFNVEMPDDCTSFVKVYPMPWDFTWKRVLLGLAVGVVVAAVTPTVVNWTIATVNGVAKGVGIERTDPTKPLIESRMQYWTKKVVNKHRLKFLRYDADPFYPLPDRRHRQQAMSDLKNWNPATAILKYTISKDGVREHSEKFPADMAIVAQVSAFGNTHAFLSAETCSLKVTNVMSRLQTENYDYTTSLSQDDAYANCTFVAFAIREAKRQRMEDTGMMTHFRWLGVYAQ